MSDLLIPVSKVKELIPQKTPFDMVDELLVYEDNTVKTAFTIRSTNLFIENELFNESGMLENIAQSIALHTSYSYFLKNIPAPIGYIGAINKVKISRFPVLNSRIQTSVQIIQEFMGVTLVEGQIHCNDELCMEASMKTFIAQ